MSRRVPLLLALVVALLAGACSQGAGGARAARAPAAPAPPVVASPLGAGDAARREGRAEDALAAYERALAARPDSVPAHLRYVAALLALGRRSVARDVYARRANAPGARPVDRVMAERLETDGSTAAVRAVYARAAQSWPEDPWWKLALAELDLADAADGVKKGDEARESGDSGGARSAFKGAREALARANAEIERAAARAPSLAEVDLYRGVAASLAGDLAAGEVAKARYVEAAAAFRRATERDPSLVDAWAGLADAAYRAGDAAGALDAWVAAVRLAPGDAGLREGAGLALHDLSRHAEAAAQYVEAARAAPANANALVLAGDAFAAAGAYDDALHAYEGALERDPTLVDVYARKGAVLERTGRPIEARRAYGAYLSHGGPREAEIRRRIERLALGEGLR